MSDTPKTNPVPVLAPGYVRHPGIYLAYPAYGGKIDSPFAICVMQLMQMPDLVAHIDVMNGDSLVSRARNKLSRNFLEGFPVKDQATGETVKVLCDWMLFIDTDLIFQASDVRKLYDIAVQRGPNIYCGTYPIKQLKPKIVFNQLEGAVPDADGIIEVRESGTGFMLIHRTVFEKMVEKFADQIRYEADAGNMSVARQIEHDFFTVGVAMDPVYKFKRYLSEDWYFCQRWREIGGKVLLHTMIQCQHIGQITYPVPPKDIAEVAKIHADALAAMKRHQEKTAQGAEPYVPERYKPQVAAVA